MPKGLRVLLQLFQVLFLLAALLFMTFTILTAYFDFGMSAEEGQFANTWVIGFGVLAIAVSPALWSLRRAGAGVAAASGGLDRVGATPSVPAPPAKPGGVFEPMNQAGAPAPPSSSYGQQPAAGFGSAPQNETPWGSGR